MKPPHEAPPDDSKRPTTSSTKVGTASRSTASPTRPARTSHYHRANRCVPPLRNLPPDQQLLVKNSWQTGEDGATAMAIENERTAKAPVVGAANFTHFKERSRARIRPDENNIQELRHLLLQNDRLPNLLTKDPNDPPKARTSTTSSSRQVIYSKHTVARLHQELG